MGKDASAIGVIAWKVEFEPKIQTIRWEVEPCVDVLPVVVDILPVVDVAVTAAYTVISIEIWKQEVTRLGKEATSDAMSAWLVHVLEKPRMIRKCFATTGALDVGHSKQVRSQTPKKMPYRSLGNFREAISRNMSTFADSARQDSLTTSSTRVSTRYDKCILRCIPTTLIFVC